MPPHRYERLVEHVRRQAGDLLRAAMYYDADGREVLYRRPDLPEAALRLDADELADRLRERDALATESDVSGVRGPAEATIELHENLVFVHLHESDQRGALLSLDRRVAQNLSEFVDDCVTILVPTEERRFFAADRGEEELG